MLGWVSAKDRLKTMSKGTKEGTVDPGYEQEADLTCWMNP